MEAPPVEPVELNGRARSPLRIALVHPFWWTEVHRGGERYLADLAWYLVQAGHRVDVVTGTSGRGGNTVDAESGATLRRRHHATIAALGRRGVSPLDTFGLVAAAALLIPRYDIVHALTPTAALAARLSGQRTVYTVLGHPTPDQFGQRPLDLTLFSAACRWSHCTAALSYAAGVAVQALTSRSTITLNPGVRTDRFAADSRTAPACLAPGQPPRILFCSDASVPRKGTDTLLGAFSRVLDHHPGARLELAGPGDHHWALAGLVPVDRDRVEAAIDDRDPAAVDLAASYRAAAVTVLPSRQEAFGLVLVESLAAGTPVVCSDEGAMAEIVDRPEVGRRVPFGNVAALTRALLEALELARDPATPSRCANHARKWDWLEVVGPAHEKAYAALATTVTSGKTARGK